MDILNSINLTLYIFISRDWCSGVVVPYSCVQVVRTDVTPYIQYCTAIGERSLALARLVVESAHQIATAVKKRQRDALLRVRGVLWNSIELVFSFVVCLILIRGCFPRIDTNILLVI